MCCSNKKMFTDPFDLSTELIAKGILAFVKRFDNNQTLPSISVRKKRAKKI